jgi:restriction endonuclease S subunit
LVSRVALVTVQPNLGKSQIEKMVIPLQRINQQKLIELKVEQLIKLCNELKQTIQQNQKYTQELLQVALKEALEPKK